LNISVLSLISKVTFRINFQCQYKKQEEIKTSYLTEVILMVNFTN
jgi:hypothetical protein